MPDKALDDIGWNALLVEVGNERFSEGVQCVTFRQAHLIGDGSEFTGYMPGGPRLSPIPVLSVQGSGFEEILAGLEIDLPEAAPAAPRVKKTGQRFPTRASLLTSVCQAHPTSSRGPPNPGLFTSLARDLLRFNGGGRDRSCGDSPEHRRQVGRPQARP